MNLTQSRLVTDSYLGQHVTPECLMMDTNKAHGVYDFLTLHKCLCGWSGWLVPENR